MSLNNRLFTFTLALITSLGLFISPISNAASSYEINVGVKETLKRFRNEIPGGSEFLEQAKAVLIFPSIIKAGFGIGGEYGEGALQIGGKTKAYYST
ncbi:MAG: hypothetical protein PSN44_08460, partial [Gammaproteobacteria bacterium]|nr:hypothetical protein [Gammaproteobacteria bacterium]